MQHAYLRSDHPLSISRFEKKNDRQADGLARRMRALVSPSFEHAYHNKINVFLAIKSIRLPHVLLNAIKH